MSSPHVEGVRPAGVDTAVAQARNRAADQRRISLLHELITAQTSGTPPTSVPIQDAQAYFMSWQLANVLRPAATAAYVSSFAAAVGGPASVPRVPAPFVGRRGMGRVLVLIACLLVAVIDMAVINMTGHSFPELANSTVIVMAANAVLLTLVGAWGTEVTPAARNWWKLRWNTASGNGQQRDGRKVAHHASRLRWLRGGDVFALVLSWVSRYVSRSRPHRPEPVVALASTQTADVTEHADHACHHVIDRRDDPYNDAVWYDINSTPPPTPLDVLGPFIDVGAEPVGANLGSR